MLSRILIRLMAIKAQAVAQELAAFMARAAVQDPVFREARVVIINSSLVKEVSSSSSRVIRAIQNS